LRQRSDHAFIQRTGGAIVDPFYTAVHAKLGILQPSSNRLVPLTRLVFPSTVLVAVGRNLRYSVGGGNDILRLLNFFKGSEHGDEPAAATRGVFQLLSLCKTLLSARSEISGRQVAARITSGYTALDAPARAAFFNLLVKEFSPDPSEVGQAGEAYSRDPSPDNLARLLRVVEPRRQELFRRLNMASDGTRVLVDMRTHLIPELGRHPLWKSIEGDLVHLLSSWFNRGFLVLKRIDWNTSANILEKLIRYEAVHQIQGWEDLRRRLEADRRCYAFFHPVLPDEPVIFIEVALTRGISEKVQPLLDPTAPVLDPDAMNCAMFYSITNCHEGLRGVPLGSFLIKQVAEDLRRDLPHLRRFATLSPVPGFRKWLGERMEAIRAQRPILAESLAKIENPKWPQDKQLAWELQKHLVPLCAYYLVRAKEKREPRDSVARFHLRNGACLERINWLADLSHTGMERSAGLMANYVYRLNDLERNHDLYMKEYRIATSSEISGSVKRFSTVYDNLVSPLHPVD
jgi:malonyl-CoA decarboxylase